MPIVRNTLIDAAINPRSLARVTVDLIASETQAAGGFISSTGEEIVERWSVETDDNGAWSVTLYPSTSVTPENSYYRVTEKVPRREAIINDIEVPVGGGPYDLYDILKEDPGALPPGSSINNHKNNTSDPHAAAGYTKVVTYVANITSPSTTAFSVTAETFETFSTDDGGNVPDIVIEDAEAGDYVEVLVSGTWIPSATCYGHIDFQTIASTLPVNSIVRGNSVSDAWAFTKSLTGTDHVSFSRSMGYILAAEDVDSGTCTIRPMVRVDDGAGNNVAGGAAISSGSSTHEDLRIIVKRFR